MLKYCLFKLSILYFRYRDWIALSNFITPFTVNRVRPKCGCIYSCPQFLSKSSTTKDRLANLSIEKKDLNLSNIDELLPSIEVEPGTKVI